MKIQWTNRALRELQCIADYIEINHPTHIFKVIMRISKSITGLTQYPHLGRVGRVVKTRELFILQTPYIVVYRIIDNDIQILTLLHTSRQWPDQL